jgi:hypothetical protein
MTSTQLRPGLPQLPPRMRRLPVDPDRGYPVPWFVEWIKGKPDFRVASQERWNQAVRFKRCWVCGGQLGAHLVFGVGPMCLINLISAEPPSHRECAEFSARACPFLATPKERRREASMPEEATAAPGHMLLHNPGVFVTYVTRSYKVVRATAGQPGQLITMGPAEEVSYWKAGRTATREEIIDAINIGFPIVREAAEKQGNRAMAEIDRRHAEVMAALPAE